MGLEALNSCTQLNSDQRARLMESLKDYLQNPSLPWRRVELVDAMVPLSLDISSQFIRALFARQEDLDFWCRLSANSYAVHSPVFDFAMRQLALSDVQIKWIRSLMGVSNFSRHGQMAFITAFQFSFVLNHFGPIASLAVHLTPELLAISILGTGIRHSEAEELFKSSVWQVGDFILRVRRQSAAGRSLAVALKSTHDPKDGVAFSVGVSHHPLIVHPSSLSGEKTEWCTSSAHPPERRHADLPILLKSLGALHPLPLTLDSDSWSGHLSSHGCTALLGRENIGTFTVRISTSGPPGCLTLSYRQDSHRIAHYRLAPDSSSRTFYDENTRQSLSSFDSVIAASPSLFIAPHHPVHGQESRAAEFELTDSSPLLTSCVSRSILKPLPQSENFVQFKANQAELPTAFLYLQRVLMNDSSRDLLRCLLLDHQPTIQRHTVDQLCELLRSLRLPAEDALVSPWRAWRAWLVILDECLLLVGGVHLTPSSSPRLPVGVAILLRFTFQLLHWFSFPRGTEDVLLLNALAGTVKLSAWPTLTFEQTVRCIREPLAEFPLNPPVSLPKETPKEEATPPLPVLEREENSTSSASKSNRFTSDEIKLAIQAAGNRVLGHGSFGSVFAAQLRQSSVAIKVLLSKMELVRQEIAVLSDTRHPNVVYLMGVCLESDYCALIMELLPNGSLTSLIDRSRPRPSIIQSLCLLLQIAQALEWVHSLGVLHRDLKPDNILLDDEWNAKVCDFGLSVELSDQRRQISTPAVGSCLWSSPEVLSSQPYGHPRDVYAFAVIAWQLICGQLEPFPSVCTLAELRQAVVAHSRRPSWRHWPPPEEGSWLVTPGAESSAQQLIDECWASDPAQRPDFAQIVKRLQEIIMTGCFGSNPSFVRDHLIPSSRSLGFRFPTTSLVERWTLTLARSKFNSALATTSSTLTDQQISHLLNSMFPASRSHVTLDEIRHAALFFGPLCDVQSLGLFCCAVRDLLAFQQGAFHGYIDSREAESLLRSFSCQRGATSNGRWLMRFSRRPEACGSLIVSFTHNGAPVHSMLRRVAVAPDSVTFVMPHPNHAQQQIKVESLAELIRQNNSFMSNPVHPSTLFLSQPGPSHAYLAC